MRATGPCNLARVLRRQTSVSALCPPKTILQTHVPLLCAMNVHTVKTRILTNTRSLLFLGVPHRGLRASTIQKLMSFYRVIGFLPRLFEEKSTKIWPTADECRRMLEAFAPISDRFEIFTFCDSIRSVTDHLFDPMTYYMGLPNERVIHLNSTYRNMIRLSSLNADLMKIVGPIRSTFIKLGPTPQGRNWSFGQFLDWTASKGQVA